MFSEACVTKANAHSSCLLYELPDNHATIMKKRLNTRLQMLVFPVQQQMNGHSTFSCS